MNWHYHPNEIVVWSPLGESDLSQALATALQARVRTAWVHHGADAPALVDSTSPVRALRSEGVWAGLEVNGQASLLARSGHPDLPNQRMWLADADVVVVQGWLTGNSPVVLELGPQGQGMETVDAEIARVRALVGGCPPLELLPSGGIVRLDRSEVDELADHVLDGLEQTAAQRPLVALFRPGKQSPRELDGLREVLQRHCSEIVLDIAPEQEALWGAEGLTRQENRHLEWGDMGLLITTRARFPQAAILMVSAEVEGMGRERLERLLAGRAPLMAATAFRARDTHLTEPWCAVWEPRSALRPYQMLSVGITCLRKTLVQSQVHLLDEFGRPSVIAH
jgi:hypothetical protein